MSLDSSSTSLESGSSPRRPSSPSAMSATSGSSSSTTKASRLERLQSHMLTSLLSLQSVPPPNRLPVAKNKEPLSLPTTTRNFRGFVQKSGPVFAIQDAVHETLMWDHPARTLCVMGIWGIIALYPNLLVPLPTFLLSLLLLQTYHARYPTLAANEDDKVKPADVVDHAVKHPTSTGHGKPRPPIVPEPPNEGSIKYYENLRDIQNMMKMITDIYDLLSPFAIHLNWSTPDHTLRIFQSLLLVTLALFLISPYLPYRLILLVAGEGALIANHPWVQPTISQLSTRFFSPSRREGRALRSSQRKMMAQMHEWMRMDSLPDEVWERGWRDIEVYENERHSDDAATARAADRHGLGHAGKWSGHALRFGERKPWTRGADGFADATGEELGEGYTLDVSRRIAMSLPTGWKWVEGDEWRIDFVGRWTSAAAGGVELDVDEEGWLYTDADWHNPAGYAYGHEGQPSAPPKIEHEDDEAEDDEKAEVATIMSSKGGKKSGTSGTRCAETRRRRWLRRAMRVVGDEDLPAQRV